MQMCEVALCGEYRYRSVTTFVKKSSQYREKAQAHKNYQFIAKGIPESPILHVFSFSMDW
jgi:hypothetical protein